VNVFAPRFARFSLLVILLGCGGSSSGEKPGLDPAPPLAPVDTSGGDPSTEELRSRLGANEVAQFRRIHGKVRIAELAESGVTSLEGLKGLGLWAVDAHGLPISDLTPLKEMPLQDLFLEGTEVTDLSPLQGKTLKKLYLTKTKVANLTPLRGMKLDELNLFGSRVTDISPLSESEIGTLWLRDTRVSDISPLAGKSLVSLDLQETLVADLSPLAAMKSLQRLNIARSDVSDLTPIADLKLTRLILTPKRIQKGLDAIRGMTSLTELDVELRDEGRLTPEQFWKRYEDGEFSK